MPTVDEIIKRYNQEKEARRIGKPWRIWTFNLMHIGLLVAEIKWLRKNQERKNSALELIEDILGFHQGSEAIRGSAPGCKPTVEINAQQDNGDFQRMLYACRAAMSQDHPVAEQE